MRPARTDSTRLGIRSLVPPPVDDSMVQAAAALDSAQAAALDSAQAAALDSVQAAALDSAQVEDPAAGPIPPLEPPPTRPQESRPPLYQRLVLRVGSPWVPGGAYVIEVFGVRNVNGVAADGTGGLQAPESTPPPETPDDSLAPARPDSSGS